jgi:NTE family protein
MRIGICLSGGGARGAFHMGVLQAFDESGIKISILSGCSAGALVGSLYAAGIKPDSMLSLAVATRWFNFLKPSFPNRGLIGMDYLEYILKKNIPHDNFSELNIPIKITATNISKGTLKVFDTGEIIRPVLASCSVPMLFKPILIDDEFYLDGGILMNLPAHIIRDECDFLIGVSLMPLQAMSMTELNSSFKLMARILELSVNNNSKSQMLICDMMIETLDISPFSRFDLRGADSLFKLGYHCSMQKMEEIKSVFESSKSPGI